jgi:hypothetical protein
MPRPGRLSARLFNEAGFSPGPPKDGVATRHARSIFEPEENRLSRSPGDFARVSPNHPGTGPTSPATQTGVSVVGREKYGTGFQGGDLRG